MSADNGIYVLQTCKAVSSGDIEYKYPPLPQPFYDRGDFGSIETDCYNDEQMRAYADAATNTLRAEKDRLTACLEKANASAENFEREWYLRGDELDNLRAQLAEAQRDAERYRSLRRGQKWSVIDWKGDALRADDLDASIDAARGESNA